jgi:hypothetical protein
MDDKPPPIAIPFFTPVPLRRSRKDGWTPARQRIFLAALAATGMVSRAARAAGMGVTSAYNLRRRKGAESFAAAWSVVEEAAREEALERVMEAARHGTIHLRFYAGRFVGTAHRYDHRTSVAALRAAFAVPSPRRPK